MVLTHAAPAAGSTPNGEEFHAGDPAPLLARLAAEGVERVYVDGGAVIRQLMDAGLIDDLTLSIVPVVLGDGIRLFQPGMAERRLQAAGEPLFRERPCSDSNTRSSRLRAVQRDLILILDFGAQYSQLIARRVREQKVYSEIHPFDLPLARIRELAPRGIILSGGPASAYDEGAPAVSAELFDLGIPILGICYGVQLTALLLGGQVVPAERREYGRASVRVKDASDLFHGFPADAGHVGLDEPRRPHRVAADRASSVVGESANCPAAAVAAPARKFWGVQFHPEVAHTPRGGEILGNFIFRICGCQPIWTMNSFVDDAVADGQAPGRRAGPGGVRPVGRRRFVGGGGAGAARDGRSPDVDLRRHRPVARGRGGAGRGALPRRVQGRPARGRRPATASWARWRA